MRTVKKERLKIVHVAKTIITISQQSIAHPILLPEDTRGERERRRQRPHLREHVGRAPVDLGRGQLRDGLVGAARPLADGGATADGAGALDSADDQGDVLGGDGGGGQGQGEEDEVCHGGRLNKD